jgi:hypothetical protein
MFHPCAQATDLFRVFSSIATGCTAADGLVARFSEILSDAISLNMTLDHI